MQLKAEAIIALSDGFDQQLEHAFVLQIHEIDGIVQVSDGFLLVERAGFDHRLVYHYLR